MTTEFKYENKTLDGDYPRIAVTQKFIDDNKLSLVTGEQAYLLLNSDKDMFGMKAELYLRYIPLDLAKPILDKDYLKEIEEGKEVYNTITSVEETAQDFLDYMVFAWGKAVNQRGSSAARSLWKLSAWLRVMSRPDLADLLNDPISPYGLSELITLCDVMDIPVPDEVSAAVE